MKKLGTLVLFLFMVAGINAQKEDKRVDEIRNLYDQTNQRISEAGNQEQSDIFVVEVNVNRGLNPYPAVGIYTSTTKFYHTYFDREHDDPYPGRLMKVEVVVRRSATTTKTEFLYNAAGDLVFANVRTDGDEPREIYAYFSRGQLIKMIDDDKDVSVKLKAVLETAQTLKAESVRMKGVFSSAIKEGF